VLLRGSEILLKRSFALLRMTEGEERQKELRMTSVSVMLSEAKHLIPLAVNPLLTRPKVDNEILRFAQDDRRSSVRHINFKKYSIV